MNPETVKELERIIKQMQRFGNINKEDQVLIANSLMLLLQLIRITKENT